ncbi:MAG: acetyl-CoA carboxylase carboxyl transferase subunit alpha [Aquificaceae bacterium]|nr:MAG: acetyl-CoA carboxylase carboxyl transferase subunit alpha [Aquificaceae bacterium]
MELKKVEKLVDEIKEKIKKLKEQYYAGKTEVESELRKFQKELKTKVKEFFKDLSPWDRVQLARHPKRPHTKDYIEMIFDNFQELHGDRFCGDDPSIVAGIGYFYGKPVAVIGHEKGRDTKERMKRNFGMTNPEGYKKANRIMKLAEKFRFPVVTFVDTPGAFPGIEAEEHNQSKAIADSIYTMAYLKVPTVSVIIGEGGSGGALALAVADRVFMLQNSVYSVISPEGCAAILWKDQKAVEKAAEALKLTAQDLLQLGVIDGIIPEPYGAAHIDPLSTARVVKYCLKKTLNELTKKDISTLLEERLKKYSSMGVFEIAPTIENYD